MTPRPQTIIIGTLALGITIALSVWTIAHSGMVPSDASYHGSPQYELVEVQTVWDRGAFGGDLVTEVVTRQTVMQTVTMGGGGAGPEGARGAGGMYDLDGEEGDGLTTGKAAMATVAEAEAEETAIAATASMTTLQTTLETTASPSRPTGHFPQPTNTNPSPTEQSSPQTAATQTPAITKRTPPAHRGPAAAQPAAAKRTPPSIRGSAAANPAPVKRNSAAAQPAPAAQPTPQTPKLFTFGTADCSATLTPSGSPFPEQGWWEDIEPLYNDEQRGKYEELVATWGT